MDEDRTYGDLLPALATRGLLHQMWDGGYAIGGQAKIPTTPKKRTVELLADHALVMELIARGYAVAKLPAEELAEGVGG